jgi:hypothetical protein
MNVGEDSGTGNLAGLPSTFLSSIPGESNSTPLGATDSSNNLAPIGIEESAPIREETPAPESALLSQPENPDY